MNRRRVLLAAAALLLPLGGLETRLAWIQLLRPHEYLGNAAVRRSIDLAPAPRGRILDRAGRTLARDEWSFDVHVVLEEFERRPEARADLQRLLRLPPSDFDPAFERIFLRIEKLMKQRPERERPTIYARERRTPYPLFENIPRSAAYAIETAAERMPGLVVLERPRRVYPFGETGAYAVGYVQRASSDEEEARQRFGSGATAEGLEALIGADELKLLVRRGAFLDLMIGRAGVERTYDESLRGRPGLRILERDPKTGFKTWVELKAAEPGRDIRLSIDIEVQRDLEAILREARAEDGTPATATAVVADPRTGELLAFGSSVSYDPNAFIPPTDNESLHRYFTHPGRLLFNRAIQGRFQLGSIFKVVTAVAGLEGEHVTPSTELPCHGKFVPTSNFFNCWIWNRGGGMHGDINLVSALERSCNCYFYGLGERIGLEELSRWATRLGYGESTGIDLPGEIAGALPTPSTHPRWRKPDTYSLSIGQHELGATPMQVMRMTCAIANGGRRVTPHVVPEARRAPESAGIHPSTLAALQEGLIAVVQGAHGTARETDLGALDAAGKTGSAQTYGRKESHAWFAGYAPAHAPRYAFVVLVEHGGHGSHAAAPIAARIAKRLFEEPSP
ncbi:MAG: hypothetical protein HY716_09930 [Planctomycetes bacterium]|nr:hypothetical protein [Planctomycetota bacterium]